MRRYDGSTGLIVRPVYGGKFTVDGEVTSKYYPEYEETVYYCGWESFPEEIVVGICYGERVEWLERSVQDVQLV